VVGIRSIGAVLSAVCSATLHCERTTVRPTGHPYDRELRFTGEQAAVIRRHLQRDARFFIVDEGPGLSGSSFISCADALEACGVPREQIALFPSWPADGSTLNNDHARTRWRELARYVVEFEAMWVASGRLARRTHGGLRDFSAGRWRSVICRDAGQWPAVQPQHEQRKYLVESSSPDGAPTLLKFVGLGRYGRPRLERAELLADAGYAPRPLGLDGGFLRTEFVTGNPVEARHTVVALTDRAADYLAFVRRRFATGAAARFSEIAQMIELNAREALGEWPPGAAPLGQWRALVEDSEVTAIDGRMLAHEWIRSDRGGFLKTDALSHHDDHFWPGCQDIAWDVAATVVELRLAAPGARSFVDRYRRWSGDTMIGARLPFWRVAYLASRLGYVAMAAGTLGSTPDGWRMRELERRYANALRGSLAALRAPTGVGGVPA